MGFRFPLVSDLICMLLFTSHVGQKETRARTWQDSCIVLLFITETQTLHREAVGTFFFFPPFLKVCSTIMDHCWIYVITLTSVGVIRNRKTMAKQGQTQALVILVGNGMVPAERTHVSVCACVCLCCAWVLIWVMRKERLEKLTVAAVCCFSTHPLSSGCGAVKVFMWVCDTPRCSKRLHLFCQRDLRVRSVYRAPRRSLALWPACVRKLFVLISQRFFQLCGSVLWKKREERRRWGERDSWPSNSITSAAGLDGPLMIV